MLHLFLFILFANLSGDSLSSLSCRNLRLHVHWEEREMEMQYTEIKYTIVHAIREERRKDKAKKEERRNLIVENDELICV